MYLNKKPSPYDDSIAKKRNYYKNTSKRDMFHLYDRNMNHMDLKSNPRLNNFDSIYIPRISTGYAFGAAGYYPKRY